MSGVDLLVKVYGPWAFGLVTLFAVWLVIVNPTMDAAKIDTQNLKAVSDSLAAVSTANQATAQSNKEATIANQATAQANAQANKEATVTLAMVAATMERTSKSLADSVDELRKLRNMQ